MENFLTEQVLLDARRHARRSARILHCMLLGGVLLLLILCLFTRTGNARAMLFLSWGILIPLGWCVLLFRMFREEPAQAELRHLEGLISKEPEVREGRLFLTGDSFRIPKSVRVLKVRLETGKEALSLNLNERLRDRIPPDDSVVRLQIANRFITAIEVLSPGPVRAPSPRQSRGKGFLRAAGRFFPAAVLWVLIALIGIGFVFTRITDADPKQKIVLFADCEVRDGAGLAEQLEKGLNGAVRMVKVHPFSFAMFNSEQLKDADLFLVPDSHRDQYAEWFSPLEGTPETGIPVYDPASGLSTASSWLLYTPVNTEPEIWRLYFGANSPHREDGLAQKAAELFLSLADSDKEVLP